MIRPSDWQLGGAAMTCAIALAACTPPPTPTDTAESAVIPSTTSDPFARYDLLAAETLIVQASEAADLTDLISVLPQYVNLDWSATTRDPETGATAFTDFKIGLNFGAEFGLSFDELRVWGLDTTLLAAKLQGQRLSESGSIFTRLEGEDIAYYGVDAAFNQLFASMFGVSELDLPEAPSAIAPVFSKFDYTIENLVMTELRLRPWELSPWPLDDFASLPEADREAVVDAVHLGQQILAIGRSVAYDDAYAENAAGSWSVRQMGSQTETSFSADKIAVSGANGFDFDDYLVGSIQMDQTFSGSDIPVDDDLLSLYAFGDDMSFQSSATYGFGRSTKLRLDRLGGFLARGEFPSLSERDLVSLGRAELQNFSQSLDGGEFIKAKSLIVDASEWQWLIPSKLSVATDDMVIGTQSLAEFGILMFDQVLASAADEAPEPDPEMDNLREGISRAIEQLADHELDQLPFDGKVSAQWNGDTGPADFAAELIAEGYGEHALTVNLTFPTYDAIQDASESDDTETALNDAFSAAFAFRGLTAREVDLGGYDKLYAYAHELGKIFPDQGWGATLAGMSPDDMRRYVGTIVRLGKASAAEEFPPAAEWLESLASYYEQGGAFTVSLAPPVPLTEALIDSYGESPDPEEVVKIFGITVTHKK